MFHFLMKKIIPSSHNISETSPKHEASGSPALTDLGSSQMEPGWKTGLSPSGRAPSSHGWPWPGLCGHTVLKLGLTEEYSVGWRKQTFTLYRLK